MSEWTCPTCGAGWPADLNLRFCGKCGREIDASTPEITSKERRTLSVLFADIAGFTTFSEDWDPETVERLVDPLFAELGDVVESYGGYVDKYMGDAVMAVFGAPEAHEDDPLRAVRAGFEMIEAVEAFNAERGEDLVLSIGINHGEVVWSRVGGGEYTVTGDAVNVAQRLEAEAEDDTVLVSRAVQKQTADVVQYARQSPLDVEGRKAVVQPYVARTMRTDVGVSAETGRVHAPLFGRDAELERLITRYEDPAPRFLAVTGEAGIGKSRLLAEFKEWLVDRPAGTTLVAGQCSQHGEVQLEPFAEYLLSRADTGRGSPDAGRTVAESIHEDLADTDLEEVRRENIGHLLAISAGLEVPEARVMHLESEQLQEAIVDAWTTWLRERARERPVVIQLEDLHWADEATRDLLDTLRDHLTANADEYEHSVTVVGTYRPEGTVSEGVEELELTPLDTADVRAVAESILNSPIKEDLVVFLADHTGGNPYFLEEVLRYLLENDMLAETPEGYRRATDTDEAVSIPDTLNGLLTGRIDALPPAASDTLKGASVIGERFWVDVLGATLEVDVREAVETLETREMIHPRPESTLSGDEEYAFKHTLLHEAALELLPRATRRELHGSVADALVDAFETEETPLAGRIAHHYERAGESDTAFTYYRKAGAAASDAYANEEAIDAYRRALALAREHEVATDDEIATTYAALADVYNVIGDLEGASEAVDAGLAVSPPGSEARCRLLGERVRMCETKGSYEETEEAATRQRKLAASLPSKSQEAAAIRSLGRVAENRGDFEKAQEYFERSLAIREEIGDRRGQADSLDRLGVVAWRRGAYDRARERHERSLAISEDIGDRRGQTVSLDNLGVVAANRGAYDRAREYFERNLAISEEIGNRYRQASALNNLGEVARNRGAYDRAQEYNERSIAVSEEIGLRRGKAFSLTNLGAISRDRGAYDRAQEYLERSLAISEEIGDRYGQAYSLYYLGAVAANRGDYDRAREYLERSLAMREDIGDRRGKIESLTELSRVARLRGDFDAARTLLDRAGDSDVGPAIGVTIKYYTERGALARATGDYDQARAHLDDASTTCEDTSNPGVEIQIHLERTRLALARENTRAAREALETANGLITDVDMPLEEGHALALEGRIAARAGSHGSACKSWQAALDVFEEIGASREALQTFERLIGIAHEESERLLLCLKGSGR